MPRKIMLEVTQPFHRNGREVAYQPGYLFPPDADLPQGICVREVVADVPDEKPAEPKAAAAKAAAKGEASAP
jgi:hypothetical protein